MNLIVNKLKDNWAQVLISFFLFFYSIKEGIFNPGTEDFRIFLGAADALNHKSNLYFVFFETGKGFAMPYAYTPFFAMILSPFLKILSVKNIVFLWMILNIVFINRIFIIFDNIFNFQNKQKALFVAFLFSLRFVLHNYDMAQVTIFWVYLMIEAYYQLEYNKNVKISSGLIAIGVSIKILPILMMFYFVVRRKIYAVVWTLLFIIFFTFLPYLFYPASYLNIQFVDCWKTINPMQSGFTHQLFDRATQSIPSLVSNYNFYLGEFLSHTESFVLIAALLLTWLCCVFIIFINSNNLKHRKEILFSLTIFSATMMLPHQQHYSFFSAIAIYALWYVWIWEEKNYSKKALSFFVLSTLFMTFTSDLFVGNELKSLFKSYGLIGIGGVFLLISVFLNVFYLRKKNIKN